MIRLVLLLFVVTACGQPECLSCPRFYIDASAPDAGRPCDVLAQRRCEAGEKCTWLIDVVMPQPTGHIACAPEGGGGIGDECLFGAAGPTGYDTCERGLLCGLYHSTATCKRICGPDGGPPTCDANQVCVTYAGLFSRNMVEVAGLCEPKPP